MLAAKFQLHEIPLLTSGTRSLQAVQRTHVNLVDLVDAFGTNRPIKVFRTERQLSEYTIKAGKYFPRDEIEAGDLLKFLLRHIFNPGST